MPRLRVDETPDVVKGVRYEVVTQAKDRRGRTVPVVWSFASRRDAQRLADKHRTTVKVIRRSLDAEAAD